MKIKIHQERKHPLLSRRLCRIATQIPTGVPFADVGTDHAYLPISLVQSGHCPQAVAVEVREGPYQRALQAVQEAGLSDRIAVRLGDGLEPLAAGEVHSVVLAGMGGDLIRRLLTADPEKTVSFQRLILQPNMASHLVRKALLDQGWKLCEEQLVLDGDHLYEILTYEQGTEDSYQAAVQSLCHMRDLAFLKEDWFLLYLLGPRLLMKECLQETRKLQRGSLVFRRIAYETDKRRRILQGLSQARTFQQEKVSRVKEELRQLEVLSRCMHMLRQ
ncbi:MAG: hypothetical protein BAA01_12710 [Bacillus thermozeamaize]|uniref:SAM-dependent methyltransferase n=1 Tax=Bacillus thermozeamaize TaxID=230954 RepID=A0A1Y3PT21_9BACI|nr:MAG: hypothetical protein BAA01_12710 [Bacillus thermozeamaize]